MRFTKGNLQYNKGNGTWRFAEHQYDYIGDSNANIDDPGFNGWVDMFGWGTGTNPTCTVDMLYPRKAVLLAILLRILALAQELIRGDLVLLRVVLVAPDIVLEIDVQLAAEEGAHDDVRAPDVDTVGHIINAFFEEFEKVTGIDVAKLYVDMVIKEVNHEQK